MGQLLCRAAAKWALRERRRAERRNWRNALRFRRGVAHSDCRLAEPCSECLSQFVCIRIRVFVACLNNILCRNCGLSQQWDHRRRFGHCPDIQEWRRHDKEVRNPLERIRTDSHGFHGFHGFEADSTDSTDSQLKFITRAQNHHPRPAPTCSNTTTAANWRQLACNCQFRRKTSFPQNHLESTP